MNLTTDDGRNQLRSIVQRLAEFLAGAEAVFLATGLRLHGLSDRARQLLQVAQQASTIGVSEAAVRQNATYQGQLARLQRYLALCDRVSTSGAERLERTVLEVNHLMTLQAEFQRIIMRIEVVATMTRIEDQRTGPLGSGFDTLVADLRELGKLLAPAYDAIFSQASVVRVTARQAVLRQRGFVDQLAAGSAHLIGEAQRSLQLLDELAGSAAVLGKKAIVVSEKLGTSLSSVLTSLQFHDITRQMVEHVAASLDEPLRAAAPGPSPAECGALCRLAAMHLAQARHERVDALNTIAGNLRRLSVEVVDLAFKTRRWADERQGSSLLEKVQASVGQTAQAVRDHVTHEQQTIQVLASVVTSMKEMASLVGAIGRMAADTKALALNGAVKAVKIGDGGHAFEVLTTAIADVAIEVRDNVAVVSRIVARILADGQTLEEGETADLSRQVVEGGSIVAELQGLLEHLQRQHGSLVSGIEALSGDSETFRAEAEAITQRVAEAGAATVAMQTVEDELLALAEQLGADAPLPADSDSRYLAAAANRYTMAAERTIHDAAIHQVGGHQTPLQRTTATTTATELGDNVELF